MKEGGVVLFAQLCTGTDVPFKVMMHWRRSTTGGWCILHCLIISVLGRKYIVVYYLSTAACLAYRFFPSMTSCVSSSCMYMHMCACIYIFPSICPFSFFLDHSQSLHSPLIVAVSQVFRGTPFPCGDTPEHRVSVYTIECRADVVVSVHKYSVTMVYTFRLGWALPILRLCKGFTHFNPLVHVCIAQYRCKTYHMLVIHTMYAWGQGV